VPSAPGAASVRVWHLMSRGWVPRTGQPLAEGASVGYPLLSAERKVLSAEC